jgi:hypothetical protein
LGGFSGVYGLCDQRPFKVETDDLDSKHRVLLNALIRVILRRMENDDHDLKDYSLPLFRKQSTDDRDDNARPDLFNGSAKANLESLKGKLIHRDTKLNVHAPSNDEDYLMSDATSELTWQTASEGVHTPLTDISGSSGPGASPLVGELPGNTTGLYYVFVGGLTPEVNNDILATAFSIFGTILDARVMWDNISRKSREYGFLGFVDKTDAEQAIAIMNGRRLGSREIRVNWANQEIERIFPTTTASSRRPLTSGGAPASSGSEYGRLLHGSLPLLGEPSNTRLLVDGGSLEGSGALEDSPDFAAGFLSTLFPDPDDSSNTLPYRKTLLSEGFVGSLLSDPEDNPLFPDTLRFCTLLTDPEDNTLFPDTLPHCKTHPSQGSSATLLSDPEPRTTVASAKMISFSQMRRTHPARFKCSLCTQTFTTNANLKSKPPSADVVAHELINIFQTMSMFTWALRATFAVVRSHLLLGLLSGDILKLVKCRRNLCHNQADMKMNLSIISKHLCLSVATTRPSGVFSASCRTIPSTLSSALLSPSRIFQPFQRPDVHHLL